MIACAYFPPKRDPEAEDVLRDEAYQVVGSAPAEDSLRGARNRADGGRRDQDRDEGGRGQAGRHAAQGGRGGGADLLVVGNRGLNTLAGRIIGSVPLDVVRHTPIDVLIVHTT